MARTTRRISCALAGLALTLLLASMAAASAAPYPNPPGQKVTPTGGPAAAAPAASVAPSENLPFTGGDVAALVALGLGAAGAGAGVVVLTRQRRTA